MKNKDFEIAFDLLCDIIDAWDTEKERPRKPITVRKIQKAYKFLYCKSTIKGKDKNIDSNSQDEE